MKEIRKSMRSEDAISFESSCTIETSFLELVKRNDRVSDVAGRFHRRGRSVFFLCSKDLSRNGAFATS